MIDVLEKWPGDALFSIEDCGFFEFFEKIETYNLKIVGFWKNSTKIRKIALKNWKKNTENPEKYCQKILEKVRKISSEWNGVIATN